MINFISHKLKLIRRIVEYESRTTICTNPPSTLWIEPTNYCNLKCIMCPQNNKMTRKKGMMDVKLFKKVIDEVYPWHPTIKLYHSGESLLHPQIYEMIKYAKDRGCYTILHTNATLLDRDKSDRILETELDELSFSFDGVTKETYESIRLGADFNKTLNNIYQFLDTKKSKNRTSPVTIMEIIKVENTENELEEFYRKFRPAVNRISIRPLMDWAGAVDIRSAFISLEKGGYTPCHTPWMSCSILWDGSVVPCCMDFDAKYILGNVKNENLSDIWNNVSMRRLRGLLSGGNYQEIELCRSCNELWWKRRTTLRSWVFSKLVKMVVLASRYPNRAKRFNAKSVPGQSITRN